eukprot:TRINITY_DN22015_c0_g1_i1.p1 TRINITY_DN22015_c0_g1~~TRINITY_DN22015_c0_g1_i1.p1  ORF type:complete len:686 (+),score=264.51 TRINITY_DN22015_c0_g1_i1:90-2147(+)
MAGGASMRHMSLLAETFPNRYAAATEIVNLQTVMSLPKGTEHIISDIHGEYESFIHVMQSGSGVIRRHISELFTGGDEEEGAAGGLTEEEQGALATLIYYPEERMRLVLKDYDDLARQQWFRKHLNELLVVLQSVSSKYTRKYVAKAIPQEFHFIITELLYMHAQSNAMSDKWVTSRAMSNKARYFQEVLDSVVTHGKAASDLVTAVATLIKRLCIDHLHICGDIYDRGPGAHLVMDEIMKHRSFDIQWGNHDVLWMAGAAGGAVSLCTAVRISLRYSNMITLEDAYGISMLSLAQLALAEYGNDPNVLKFFKPKKSTEKVRSDEDVLLLARMHKAISIIQFKLEGQLIKRQPGFAMDDRLMLHTLDKEKGTIQIGGKTYPLLDTFFPTIDPKNPLELTQLEQAVADGLIESFRNSKELQRHASCLWDYGAMYKVHNGNLFLHGCLPMNKDGTLTQVNVDGEKLAGKALCDKLEKLVRQCVTLPEKSKGRQDGLDWMYYLWTGPLSPLFGKSRMTTFERYFIKDKDTHTEPKNPYMKFRSNEAACKMILKNFGADTENGVIINGHTPVKVSKGESPVKANGKLIVIDGGFSKAYQKETGIAGYTLLYNSYGLMLAQHQSFKGLREAVRSHADNHASTSIVRAAARRVRIRDTDLGRSLQGRVDDLEQLIKAFENGDVREKLLAKM